MARINLRPWREERRQQKQKEYISVLVLVAMLSAGLWYLGHSFYANAVAGQNHRNNYIKKESANLESQIIEIKELRSKRSQLLDRMKLIQDLQGNRPVIVRVFDELVRITPDNLFFTLVTVKDGKYEIKGKADSNTKVSQFMRNIDNSSWFSDPNLLGVKTNKGSYNDFDMTVVQTKPQEEEVK